MRISSTSFIMMFLENYPGSSAICTILLLLAPLSHASSNESGQSPWLDQSYAPEKRLDLFLSELSFDQKLSMVQGNTSAETDGCIGYVAGIDSMGISAVCMGDGPAGVGNNLNNVTTFPAPALITSTWDEALNYEYGQALGQEHKAKGRNVVLAPTINIVRSPLWGRAAESMSEDPFLNGRIAVAVTQGIQSNKIIACPKHFAGYNQDTNRFGLAPAFDAINAVIDERTLHEIYLPAFKAVVQEGQAGSIMCSYNKLNGKQSCENPWLYDVLKGDWGFNGFVVTDWYFAQRSTVDAALAGLDNSQPGGSWMDYYGIPDLFGELLEQAIENGSVPVSRIEDMVARLWRPMFATGAIDYPSTGNEDSVARTQVHLDLAALLVEEGAILLKNNGQTLPLKKGKDNTIAVFGADASNDAAVTELHGGFVLDTTMVVQKPVDYIRSRASKDNISVLYSEAYPGTSAFPTVPSSMFGDAGLNVTYWTTTDFSGPINQTVHVKNITAEDYPSNVGAIWPQVFSSRYEGLFYPNVSGLYHFSLYGNGGATLYLDGKQVAEMTGSNFNMVVQGIADLKEGVPVSIRLDYSMGLSVDPGTYGVSLGVNVADPDRYQKAVACAEAADVSVIFVNDEWTEGLDNSMQLRLPGDQDAVISLIAQHSKRTVVVLNTNSAILMPWIKEVDAVVETFYGGQQIGSAIARLLFGDVNFSGKLPITFPQNFNDTPTAPEERFPGIDLVANYSEGLHVGYKWYDEYAIQPLFPFGFGLSYTSFEMTDLIVNVSSESDCAVGPVVEIKVSVQNTGPVYGKEVVQLYVSFPKRANEPPKLLKGFSKVGLDTLESTTATFHIERQDLSIWSVSNNKWVMIPGEYTFLMGNSSRNIILEESVVLE